MAAVSSPPLGDKSAQTWVRTGMPPTEFKPGSHTARRPGGSRPVRSTWDTASGPGRTGPILGAGPLVAGALVAGALVAGAPCCWLVPPVQALAPASASPAAATAPAARLQVRVMTLPA